MGSTLAGPFPCSPASTDVSIQVSIAVTYAHLSVCSKSLLDAYKDTDASGLPFIPGHRPQCYPDEEPSLGQNGQEQGRLHQVCVEGRREADQTEIQEGEIDAAESYLVNPWPPSPNYSKNEKS